MAKGKIRVPRTRNYHTMTEAMFWGGIQSTLRKKSMYWRPITEIKKLNRRPYTAGINKLQKWEVLCYNCHKWFKDSEVIVHHIEDCGNLTCAEDLPGFVNRLFVEIEGLRILCKSCHNIHHGRTIHSLIKKPKKIKNDTTKRSNSIPKKPRKPRAPKNGTRTTSRNRK